MNDATHDRIRDEAIELLLRAEESPGDPSVGAALAEWRARSDAHERAYCSVARMWRVAGGLTADARTGAKADNAMPPASATAVRRRRELPRRETSVARPTRGRRRLDLRPARVVLAAAAACLILYFSAPALWTMVRADHATATGERRTVALRGGSTVYLDAESAVAVDLAAEDRTVSLLSGEAFFDVAHAPNRPFHVRADGLTVTVRGTAFTVGDAGASTSVAVREGVVEVGIGSGEQPSRVLRAGDRLTIDRPTGRVRLAKVAPSEVGAWRGGDLVVDGMPLSVVAARIGRYHRGTIVIPDGTLARRKITGVFKLSDPVAALSAAAATQNAAVTALSPYLLWVAPR